MDIRFPIYSVLVITFYCYCCCLSLIQPAGAYLNLEESIPGSFVHLANIYGPSVSGHSSLGHYKTLHHQDDYNHNRRLANDLIDHQQSASDEVVYTNQFLSPQANHRVEQENQQDITNPPFQDLAPEFTEHETSLSSITNKLHDHEHTGISYNYNPGEIEADLSERVHLTRDFIREICRLDRGVQRSEKLNTTYLTNCARYKLSDLVSNEILMLVMHRDGRECERLLEEFMQLDELINQFDHQFKNLLTRYNCHNGYSVKWSCEDCKKAYKEWLCATNLPFYMKGERIKPCISFCERVEQRCPYLHPITKEQYGGQPVFICRDPNIPFVPEITPDIPFSEPGRCYDLCHLTDNLTELTIDSLSKYSHDRCPDRGSIAEEVRNDPYYMGQSELKFIPNNNYPPEDGLYEEHELENGDQMDSQTTTMNRTTTGQHGSQPPNGIYLGRKPVHVHNKKLEELREVLAIYKNQPKTHRFGHHVEHNK